MDIVGRSYLLITSGSLSVEVQSKSYRGNLIDP